MYRLYLALAIAMTGAYSWAQYKGYSALGSDQIREAAAARGSSGGARTYHK